MREVLGLHVTDLTPDAVRQAVHARGATVTDENEYTTDLRLIGVRSVDHHVRTSGIPKNGKANFNFTDGRLASIYVSRRMLRAEFEQRVRELSAKLPLEMRKDTFARFRDRGMRLQVDLSLNISTDGAWEGEWWQGLRVPCEARAALKLVSATTTDAHSITVRYTVGGGLGNGLVRLSACRSSSPDLKKCEGPQMEAIGVETLSDPSLLTPGVHETTILKEHVLPPNPNLPYVVVVADAAGQTSQTYFRKWLMGVIVHGYTFRKLLAAAGISQASEDFMRWLLLDNGHAEDWQSTMEHSLKTVSCYDAATFAYNWRFDSVMALRSLLSARASELYLEMARRAVNMTQHAGDVVDVHFIGHSRGTVIVSQALLEWRKRWDPALKGSYIWVTLLDPHPANNTFSPQADVEPSWRGGFCYTQYKSIQDRIKDPAIQLPDGIGIKEIQVWFQHSRVKDVKAALPLPDVDMTICPMNLWGLGASADHITRYNTSRIPITWHELTNYRLAGGGLDLKLQGGTIVDHSGVVSYFQELIGDFSRSGKCVLPPR